MFPYTHFSFMKAPKRRRDSVGPHFDLDHTAKILVVESRDQVFAAIREEFRSQKFAIFRAACADEVVPILRRDRPGLVLLNAEMPDESGFLISLKLRIHGYDGGLWLYATDAEKTPASYREHCQIDRIVSYGGDFRELTSQLGCVLRRQQG